MHFIHPYLLNYFHYLIHINKIEYYNENITANRIVYPERTLECD